MVRPRKLGQYFNAPLYRSGVARGGGRGGHMSPGAGRRNRREIINNRVNENSQTHGQIPGAVVNPFI